MECNKCGNMIPEDSTFCPKCGNSLKSRKKMLKISLGILILILVGVILTTAYIFYNNSSNVSKLDEVDMITAQRIVSYHDKIFEYYGFTSACVVEGLYDKEDQKLYLKYEDDGVSVTFKGIDEKTIYLSVKNGKVNMNETEIKDFHRYKGKSNYIYFTGEEYIKFLHSQGLYW